MPLDRVRSWHDSVKLRSQHWVRLAAVSGRRSRGRRTAEVDPKGEVSAFYAIALSARNFGRLHIEGDRTGKVLTSNEFRPYRFPKT